jgi:nitroimidazol reductase NimA-like FMN-containing flavoprotein (pyridoxamine 5'-phosphate oxidase superfamily)
MTTYPVSENTSITRLPKRGVYDQESIYAILDEALFCTLSYVRDNQSFQIPTGFCRIGNKLYLHGSVGSFYMREIAEKNLPVSIGVTLLDGLVLARSAFHHSVNYRSVVIFSKGLRVTDEQELIDALAVFTNKMQPGRWDDIRKPTPGEWKATMLLSFDIDEASAKVRTGPPLDDEEDYALEVWAGVVPLALERKEPLPDAAMKGKIPLPKYLK